MDPALPAQVRRSGGVSLRHILLGLLHEPASGYDLKQQFNGPLRYFWAAELSQIYPTLGRMEDAGLLSSRTADSPRGPQRKVYRRTHRGTKVLADWLRQPEVGTERLPWLAQVFLLGEARDPEIALGLFRALRDKVQGQLDELREVEVSWRCDPRYPDALPDEDFYPQLTLNLGLRKYAVIVDWCEDCIARIEARRAARPGSG